MSPLRPAPSPAPPPSPAVALERTFDGLEARLQSTGLARFHGALFLGVWLLFWVVGEVAVLWILGAGAWCLLTGTPPGPGRAPLELAPALAMGVFLLGWLGMWTVGGLVALHEFFRLVWSSDRLCATPDGLLVIRRAGLFRRQRWLPRERLRRIYTLDTELLAETTDGAVELTRLGSAPQREQIRDALAAELKLPPPDTLPPVLPAGWRELDESNGAVDRGRGQSFSVPRLPVPAPVSRLLVKDPAQRRIQAAVAWFASFLCTTAAVVLIADTRRTMNLVPLALIFTVLAGLATWGAARLQWGRREWRIEPGRIVEQRRFGSRVLTRLIADSVALTQTRDSDGDVWLAVEIVAHPDRDPADRGRRTRRKIMSRMNDPTEPRLLATWLAAAAGVPLMDHTRSAADEQAEMAAKVKALQASGRFGRWFARRMERHGKR